jgi:site-specific recombinase XerC
MAERVRVVGAAWRAGLMDAAAYQAARDVRGVRGARLPRGRAIEPEEWRRLFREIGHEPSPIRERDTALVALAYAGGFRRAELVALDVTDYHRDSGRLRVVGKGNKERAVFLANGARDALHAWLRVRGREPGPLLLPVDRHGRVRTRRLTEQTVYDRLHYLAERAGVRSADRMRLAFAGAPRSTRCARTASTTSGVSCHHATARGSALPSRRAIRTSACACARRLPGASPAT